MAKTGQQTSSGRWTPATADRTTQGPQLAHKAIGESLMGREKMPYYWFALIPALSIIVLP